MTVMIREKYIYVAIMGDVVCDCDCTEFFLTTTGGTTVVLTSDGVMLLIVLLVVTIVSLLIVILSLILLRVRRPRVHQKLETSDKEPC